MRCTLGIECILWPARHLWRSWNREVRCPAASSEDMFTRFFSLLVIAFSLCTPFSSLTVFLINTLIYKSPKWIFFLCSILSPSNPLTNLVMLGVRQFSLVTAQRVWFVWSKFFFIIKMNSSHQSKEVSAQNSWKWIDIEIWNVFDNWTGGQLQDLLLKVVQVSHILKICRQAQNLFKIRNSCLKCRSHLSYV